MIQPDLTQPQPEQLLPQVLSNPSAAQLSSTESQTHDLLYGLDDRPPIGESILVALQHVLASFVGIVTPPIIICSSLGLDATTTSYIISMSLFASGLCTFIQCHRLGPVGSGLLSLQGTSFAFLGPIVAVGTSALQSGQTPQQALALIFGVCFFGSFMAVLLSRFLHLFSRIITPVVSGTIVMIIGLGLIKAGVISLAGGTAALARNDGSFGSLQNLALGGTVLLLVTLITLSQHRFLRMAAIAIGLAVGYLIAIVLGWVDFHALAKLPIVTLPLPFRYGMSFELGALLPFLLLYLLTAIETVGDVTATSAVSGQPVQGSLYMRRVKGGVLGDGVNSMLAAMLNTFPNTTFSQNNGIIQMTGVGSRYIGYYIAAILMGLGLLPIVGGIFQSIPQPVLGGATIVMFGSIAVAGLNLICTNGLSRRDMIIVAVSLAIGLGVLYAPEIFNDKPLMIKNLFSSSISSGGLTAILLSGLLPREVDSLPTKR